MKRTIDEERLCALLRSGAVQIVVRPGVRKNAVHFDGDRVLVEVAARAQDGEANAAIERYLSSICGAAVRIISGRSSKKKLVRMEEKV